MNLQIPNLDHVRWDLNLIRITEVQPNTVFGSSHHNAKFSLVLEVRQENVKEYFCLPVFLPLERSHTLQHWHSPESHLLTWSRRRKHPRRGRYDKNILIQAADIISPGETSNRSWAPPPQASGRLFERLRSLIYNLSLNFITFFQRK